MKKNNSIKNSKDKKVFNIPILGSIFTAIAASICCIGPVVLAVIGVGGAGIFSKFEIVRPYFIVFTLILIGLGFYLTYRKKEVLCENGTCKIKKANKWNKISLWSATVLVIFLLAFPYLKLSSQNQINQPIKSEVVEVIIPVQGMTCSGCEYNVEKAVNKLDGIIQVKADHKKGKTYVKFEKGKVSIDKIVNAINKTGYKATKPS